jgi:hypothetical protein
LALGRANFKVGALAFMNTAVAVTPASNLPMIHHFAGL